jgi:hypothetical protein
MRSQGTHSTTYQRFLFSSETRGGSDGIRPSHLTWAALSSRIIEKWAEESDATIDTPL